MHLRVLLAFLVASTSAGAAPVTIVKAAHVLDGVSDRARDGIAVAIEGDKIVAVAPPGELAAKYPKATTIDLGSATLLPGLVDAHTHVFLDDDVGPGVYDAILLKKSTPLRAIEATANAKKALGYGFTSIRDLETEGAMYADVDLKTAIARGVVPGPRMTVATRALAPTGMYPLRGYSWELSMPIGVQTVDGVESIRKAVREEVANGADLIKFYADHAPYESTRADRPVRSIVNFTPAEAAAIVDEAHRLGVKVAAHANGWDGIDSALRAGVDSIEHGQGLTDDLIARMLAQKVAWCPTMLAYAYSEKKLGGTSRAFMMAPHKAAFAKAYKRGVHIVFGTDAGAFPWSMNPAQEAKLMVDAGMPAPAVVRAMTSAAATLLDPFCRADARCAHSDVGVIAPGKYADLVAVAGNPLADITELERVAWVMKAGAVVTR